MVNHRGGPRTVSTSSTTPRSTCIGRQASGVQNMLSTSICVSCIWLPVRTSSVMCYFYGRQSPRCRRQLCSWTTRMWRARAAGKAPQDWYSFPVHGSCRRLQCPALQDKGAPLVEEDVAQLSRTQPGSSCTCSVLVFMARDGSRISFCNFGRLSLTWLVSGDCA